MKTFIIIILIITVCVFLGLLIGSLGIIMADNNKSEYTTGEYDNTENPTIEPTVKSTPKDYKLDPGRYTIGKDVRPGIYDIKCISGSGIVYCEDNGYSDVLNLMMSAKKEEYYIISYKNAKLNNKAILFIEDVTIELRGK